MIEHEEKMCLNMLFIVFNIIVAYIAVKIYPFLKINVQVHRYTTKERWSDIHVPGLYSGHDTVIHVYIIIYIVYIYYSKILLGVGDKILKRVK